MAWAIDEPVNDKPVFSIPTAQSVDEDAKLVLHGVSIYDVDSKYLGSDEKLFVSMSVISGSLHLSHSLDYNRLTFTVGDGRDDSVLSFSGSLDAINLALKDLMYTGDADANSKYVTEILTLHISENRQHGH